MLEEHGLKVLDADEVVHELLEREDVKRKLVDKLGSEVLGEGGKVDRKAVARKVFKNRELLKWLENLLHPLVYERYEDFCGRHGGICVLEAALIFEKGNQKRFDKTVVVYAPFEVAKERALKRGMALEDFLRRWNNQMDIEEKKLLADFVVDNSDGLERTRREVEKLVRELKEELKRKANP